MSESDSGDEPEINHYAFMAKVARDKTASARHVLPMTINPRVLTPEEELAKKAAEEEKKQSTNFAGVMLRLVVATVFVGIGVGALVYSVFKSQHDQLTHATTTAAPTVPPHAYLCNPFVNQVSKAGLYKYANGTNKVDLVSAAQWYQDDDLKTVLLNVGNISAIPTFIIWANTSVLLTVKNGNCSLVTNGTYKSFISSFGDSTMQYERTAKFEDHQNQDVEVYFQSVQTFSNSASFVFRYQESYQAELYRNGTNPVQYGWAVYPYLTDDFFDTYRYEYWFGPTMQQETPNQTDILCPQQCSQYC